MRHSYFMRLIGLFVALTLLFPALPVAAGTPSFSPDFDGDGITDALETAGWYNLLGTSFVTDPLDADSDNDGLTDGEEKLFGTNPNYDRSPGLYARYEDSFLTREYFSTTDTAYFAMLRGGERYLMTEAMVLRRGSTLRIGGPRDASLSITSDGLTTLSSSKDVANGGWKITVPSGAKVGVYTATLSLSGWSDSMPLYVIFELPSPSSSSNFLYNLTEEAIERFAYDDDPNDLRDELSVWFYTPEWSYYKTCDTSSPPCSADPYGVKRGHAQSFVTDQFKKYVFLTYAIPTIQGTTSQSTAVTQLLSRADLEFRTNYARIQTEFYSAMYRWDDGTGITMDGGGCESNANVFTTMLRSAGIVARPFLVDWNKTPGHGESGQIGTPYQYDHAVLVWMNGMWKGARSYSSVGDAYYPWNEGVKSPTNIARFYPDKNGDLVLSVNELWEMERDEGGDLRGTVNVGYVTPAGDEQSAEHFDTWDFRWDSRAPLEIKMSPAMDVLAYESWYGDAWAPSEWGFEADGVTPKDPSGTYYLPSGVPAFPGSTENWPYNPVPTECSPSVPADECDAFLDSWGITSAAAQQSSTLMTVPETFAVFLPLVQATEQPALNSVQLGDIVRDYGVDLDGNGRFEQLVVEAEVSVARAGTYQLGGWLQAGNQALPARTDQIRLNSRYLNAKSQIVKFVFEGEDLGLTGAAGPYTVLELWVGEAEELSAAGVEPAAGTYDWQEPFYSTAAYAAGAFETMEALFADEFSHRGVDADGDGSYEALAIDVSLDLTDGGSYVIAGDLYDGDGNYLGQDTWEGTGAAAELQFSIAGAAAPYTLEHLLLFDAESGRLLDSRYLGAYVVSELAGVAGNMVSLKEATSEEFSILGARDTGVFTTTLVDNALKITMGVTVDAPGGTYRVEGLLVDERDNPVAWSVSDPQSLAAGSREMTLTFAGPLLYDHMLHEPSAQSFKLVAVKIFRGNLSSATLEDSVNVATTTPEYTRDDFDPANGALVFFEDDTEGGTGDWSWSSSVWSLGTSIWHSWSHAWRASTSGDGSLSLASALPVNLADYVGPYLRFRTAYDMGSGDAGYLQVSRDGGAWTTVESYTDETPHWDTEWVDLSTLGESSTARFRFNADGSSGMVWYVDDVSFVGWPAVKEASFTYEAPDPILTGQEVTFVASYDSISTTLPITYTWDFNDGTPLLSTDSPTVTHVYQAGDDYTVGLTVENPYDDAAASDSFSVYEALTDVFFTLSSATPGSDWDAVFTAVYTPTTATQPVVHTWNFGDGSAPVVTSDPSVAHTYTANGTYTVWVTAENGYGDPVTYSDDVSVPLDNDGDGLVNSVEVGIGTDPDDADSDDDGIPDDVEVGDPEDPTDSDGDGTIDALDPDDDDDGIPTADEGTGDPDDDDIPNYLDLDSDDDGILDEIEGTGDPDDDDIPNYLDSDSDGDGISDEVEGTGDPDDDDIPNYLDPDSDGDGIPDVTEGTGNPDGDGTPNYLDTDSDGDGIPDATEGTGNPDGDSMPNYLDTDSDGDGIPDAVEGTGNPDGDSMPNYLDTDSDGDGIPDATEGTGNPDGDSLPNYLDTDSDGDGIPDATEGTGNPDGDSMPNYLDTDSDGDGIPDATEGTGNPDGDGLPNYLDPDSDGDGIPDATEGTGDPDGDSLPNYLDPDSDGDGIPDATEGTGNPDGDSLPNYLDTDSDGDGIPDATEGTGNPDGDGRPNYLDTDSDGDGIPDATEGTGNPDGDSTPNYLDTDSDGDGIPDATEGTGDPDGDSTPNYLDLDSDGDGIPDEIEGTGDADGDGIPNYRDDDDDNDGIPTEDEDVDGDGDPTNDDTDGDGVPDYLDDDDDDDGIPTADEDVDGDGDPTNDDTDGDGVPDYRDDDDDGDGVPTADEDVDGSGDPTNDDTDGDGVPNYLDDDDDGDGIPTIDEDLNGDGDPTNDDTDGGSIPDYLDDDDDDDGIPTADEDVDGDGDPTNDDTDGDGTPDYRDGDDDDDGIPTADEDVDGDGDPTNDDTDGDGVPNYRDDDDDGDGVPTIDEDLTSDADGDGIPDYLDNNYNPSFTSTAALTATEDVAYAYAVTTADLDAGEQLTITAQVKPSWLALVDHKDGTATLSGTPTNDHVGDSRVTLRVVDNKGAMATQVFTITVVNVNDTPVAVDDAVVGYRNYASEVDVLENDHDPDVGDTLTIESYDATSAEGGTVSCSATLCTYTPLTGYNGLDTFSYTVRDLAGATDTATVTITVTTQVPGVGYVVYLPMVLR